MPIGRDSGPAGAHPGPAQPKFRVNYVFYGTASEMRSSLSFFVRPAQHANRDINPYSPTVCAYLAYRDRLHLFAILGK